MNKDQAVLFMKRALTLAARGTGTTHPNPMVGAVVVAGDQIIGEGWHSKPGEPHAEALALKEAGTAARGATLFVNLEPCDHTGRTPPCTDAIIRSGISHVYAACHDPHYLVDGRGYKALRKAGIKVTEGLLEREAQELNRAFFHYSRTGTPYVTLKLASTIDGRIAAPDGSSRWITGDRSRRAVHKLRAQADAVLVGVGTVIADDPRLTARGGRRKGQPLRIVLDPTLRTPVESRVIRDNQDGATVLVIGEKVSEKRASGFEKSGVRLLRLPVLERNFPWSSLGQALAGMGILHLMVEGGGNTAARLLRDNAVNRIELFLAPSVLGAEGVPVLGDLGITCLEEAVRMSIQRVKRVGEDIWITTDVK